MNEPFRPDPRLFPGDHPAMPGSTPLPDGEPMVMLTLSHAEYLFALLHAADASANAFGAGCGEYMDEEGRYCWICTALSQLQLLISQTQAAVQDGDTLTWDEDWPNYDEAPRPPLPGDEVSAGTTH